MKITLLGTSAAFPTKTRNHSATLLDIGTESILFDCGEGTQRQIALVKAKPFKISTILLTHWHGDHSLGLGGLLQSMQMNKRKEAVNIYGPEETRQRFKHLVGAFGIKTAYMINVYEVKVKQRPFKVLDAKDYEIWAIKCKHRVPCLAFAYKEKDKRRIVKKLIIKLGLEGNPLIKKLQEGKDIKWKGKTVKVKDATYLQKGKKFVYIIDSSYSEDLVKFAKDADLLLCESTFTDDMRSEANEFGHMTAKQAATIAKKAKVKQLMITHFSPRYKDVEVLLKEAKKVFPKTTAAKDLMTINV